MDLIANSIDDDIQTKRITHDVDRPERTFRGWLNMICIATCSLFVIEPMSNIFKRWDGDKAYCAMLRDSFYH